MTKTAIQSDKRAATKITTNPPRAIEDDRLEKVSGGAGRRIIIIGG